MCPICWATALASFALLIGISVVTIAGTDRWSLASAMLLAVSSPAHLAGFYKFPWWYFVLLTVAALIRIAYLMYCKRERLLVVRAWQRSCQLAAKRCPNKQESARISAYRA
jgi:hypothetical protein